MMQNNNNNNNNNKEQKIAKWGIQFTPLLQQTLMDDYKFNQNRLANGLDSLPLGGKSKEEADAKDRSLRNDLKYREMFSQDELKLFEYVYENGAETASKKSFDFHQKRMAKIGENLLEEEAKQRSTIKKDLQNIENYATFRLSHSVACSKEKNDLLKCYEEHKSSPLECYNSSLLYQECANKNRT